MTAKKKSELMREMRKKRKELGLVDYRVWCTEEQRKEHQELEAKHKKNSKHQI